MHTWSTTRILFQDLQTYPTVSDVLSQIQLVKYLSAEVLIFLQVMWLLDRLRGRRNESGPRRGSALISAKPHPSRILRGLTRRGSKHAPTTGSWRSRQESQLGGTKMVVVVRSDLRMGIGKVASQAAHAAVSLYRTACEGRHSRICAEWDATGGKKIVLRAKDYDSLATVAATARNANLPVVVVRDQGRTQVKTGTITAVGIGPAHSAAIDEVTRSFKLY